jgi:hypothetical protein
MVSATLHKNGARAASSETVAARIAELRREAKATNISILDASESDMLAFLRAHAVERRPYIALLDDGKLRAVWTNKDGEQIGLQFRGGGEVQFVLFAKRADPEMMVRSAGRDTLAGIARQIAAHDLWRLTHR